MSRKLFVLPFAKILVVFLFLGLAQAQPSLIKEGLYKSLGIGTGYYYYGEVGQLGEHLMHLDFMLFNVNGNIGYIADSGGRVDFSADANIAFGVYTGRVLDTSNAEENGKFLQSVDGNSFYHLELKGGFDILRAFGAFGELRSASLYALGGLGYYFNNNNFNSTYRLQGYLYLPLGLEGEIGLGERFALNYAGFFHLFILGNHFSSRGHFSKDLDVLQSEGLGAKAYIGATYKTKHDRVNSFRLVYEYWSLAGSPAVAMTDYTGKQIALYEPKNSSHILTLQYLWNF